mmetsp:Transcript_89383/g.158614  ORF Transcript_89383/g.158614 Transcript_89383/m.158614 type:complete len:595 (+) Transcript_89383:43-1827(+)
MSPEPETRSLQGWARANESSFLSKVQSSNGFQKVLGSYSKTLGVPLESNDLQSFAEELCKCCFEEADPAFAGEGPLAAAMQESQLLKQKLTQCQLSTMKQMAAMRSVGHLKHGYGSDTIVFHEPLQFLEPDQRELVLEIVCDKIRQLRLNTAPPSLLEALLRHANADQADGASLEELNATKAELEKARSEARTLRAQLQKVEDEADSLRGELRQVRDRLVQTQQELADSKAREEALTAEVEQLKALTAKQQAEIERQQAEIQRQKAEIKRLDLELQEERKANAKLRAEVQRLEALTAKQQAEIERQQAEIQRQQGEIQRLEVELQEEKKANAKLRAAVQQLEDELQRLQKEFADLQASHEILKKEADEMRAELARRNNTRTQGTQTSLTGSKLDEQADERKRLKVMLEEMQMKLKELVEKYRKKFGNEAKEIAKEMGIEQLLKEDTVFQRLYDDALDRVERLEKLRAKLRKERKDLGGAPESPEVTVLAAVEGSDLKSMRRFLGESVVEQTDGWGGSRKNSEKERGRESPEPPIPGKQKERGRESPECVARKEPKGLQPSVSLPSLRANSQNLNVLELKLGQRKSTRQAGALLQ